MFEETGNNFVEFPKLIEKVSRITNESGKDTSVKLFIDLLFLNQTGDVRLNQD
jgi:chromatin segregation and condensation protein Rec8/ScpA/Scc1 (kleisin family)